MKVVALGGGHGMAAAIGALRRLTPRITAVVSVADDGGSSGRLVAQLGVTPPGDARRCLLALAEGGELAELFDYRFKSGELAGHALGNLILAALEDELGDFRTALERAGGLLGCVGRVVPASADRIRLVADVGGVGRVKGQSVLSRTPGIRRLLLDPPDPAADRAALAAIAEAELVVIGPGSLFTSLLPVVCIPDVRAALEAAPGRKVFVCNLTAQAGETQDLDAAGHLQVLLDHAGADTVDVMLVNNAPVAVGPGLSVPGGVPAGVELLAAHVAADQGAVHDPARLAAALQACTRRARRFGGGAGR